MTEKRLMNLLVQKGEADFLSSYWHVLIQKFVLESRSVFLLADIHMQQVSLHTQFHILGSLFN